MMDQLKFILFTLMAIYFLPSVTFSTPKAIEMADRNFRSLENLQAKERQAPFQLSLNFLTGQPWNNHQGVDAIVVWQPHEWGLYSGLTTSTSPWSSLQMVPCYECSGTNVTDTFAPGSEANKQRDKNAIFALQALHLGINFYSRFYRRDEGPFMQLRAGYISGTMYESQYLTHFSLQGIVVAGYLSFPIPSYKNLLVDAGYSHRLAILERPGNLSRIERMLYIQMSQLHLGFSQLF